MDLGVQSGDGGGQDSCVSDFQGIGNYRHTPTAVLNLDQSMLAVIPTKADHGSPGSIVLADGEVGNANLGLAEVESFSPLITITPLGLALSAELNRGTEVLGLENTLDISNWVKHRIPGFSKLVGLPLSRHEKMCIGMLQRLEREMEVSNLLHRKAAVHRKSAISKDKGKREQRNLISSVHYDGR